jgi:hypothetical protein
MNEQHDTIGERRRAQRRSGRYTFAHVELCRLPGNCRHRRLHAHVMVNRQQPVAVVGVRRRDQ